jgi:hypothetical protein
MLTPSPAAGGEDGGTLPALLCVGIISAFFAPVNGKFYFILRPLENTSFYPNEGAPLGCAYVLFAGLPFYSCLLYNMILTKTILTQSIPFGN